MGEAKRRGTYEERKKTADFECIICREVKAFTDRSDEHVIPDSLNGYYHIFNVCLPCNANMGSKVDSKLLDYKLTELHRFSDQIKGKSGKIPYPFKEIYSLKGQPDKRVTTEFKNGEISSKFLPDTIPETNEDGTIKAFTLVVDAKDKHLLDGMYKKFMQRNNLKEDSIIKKEYVEKVIEKPELEGRWTIDTHNYRIGLLKIAYEFAVNQIPDYFKDPSAIKISNILHKANYDELNTIQITYGFEKEIFDKLSPLIDMEKKRHILILTSLGKGLQCLIKLDEVIHAVVSLSNLNYIDFFDSILCLNDLENNNYKIILLSTLFKGQSSEIYEKYDQNLIYKNNDIPGSDLIEKDDQPVLFDMYGNKFRYSLIRLCKRSYYEEEKLENDTFSRKHYFPSSIKFFVKTSITRKLYQVVGCKIDHKYKKL